MELAALAFLISIDNLRLAGALGLLETARRRWLHLSLLMAAVEAGFPLLGAAASRVLPIPAAALESIGPVMLVAAATLAVGGAVGSRRSLRGGRILYALPPLFALDNLLAGVAIRPPGHPAVSTVLMVGTISGAVSLATMIAVGRLGRRLGEQRAWAPAAVALAVGMSMVVLP